MLDTLRDGVVVVGRDRRIKYVNASYYSQFGVTPDQIKAGDDLRVVLTRMAENGQLGPIGRGNLNAYVSERLKRWGGEEGRVERRFLDNGRILDIYRSMTLDDDVVSVHVDVTNAVRSEQEIERQRLYMAKLLEHMSDGLAL
ncbi:MAG: PAS-domain containing protein, partial [Pseudomonadota bacterium]